MRTVKIRGMNWFRWKGRVVVPWTDAVGLAVRRVRFQDTCASVTTQLQLFFLTFMRLYCNYLGLLLPCRDWACSCDFLFLALCSYSLIIFTTRYRLSDFNISDCGLSTLFAATRACHSILQPVPQDNGYIVCTRDKINFWKGETPNQKKREKKEKWNKISANPNLQYENRVHTPEINKTAHICSNAVQVRKTT